MTALRDQLSGTIHVKAPVTTGQQVTTTINCNDDSEWREGDLRRNRLHEAQEGLYSRHSRPMNFLRSK